MNTKLLSFAGLAAGLVFQLCLPAAANTLILTGGASPGVVIPDNSLTGVSSTVLLIPTLTDITGVTVTVNISGAPCAYDGDYYAYLEYGSTLVTLMSNPGAGPYGSPANGFSVTFTDSAATSINTATAPPNSPLTGSYLPQSPLAAFNGTVPVTGYNDLWTLFIADTSPGGVGQLDSWSLTVTGDKFPDNTSTLWLLAMGVGCLGLLSLRQPRAARLTRR